MKEFIKNKRQKILIQNKEFKGRKYVDIRTYFLNNDDGEYKPSSKGITIPLDKFEEFKKIFDSHNINDDILDDSINTSNKSSNSKSKESFEKTADDLINKLKKSSILNN